MSNVCSVVTGVDQQSRAAALLSKEANIPDQYLYQHLRSLHQKCSGVVSQLDLAVSRVGITVTAVHFAPYSTAFQPPIKNWRRKSPPIGKHIRLSVNGYYWCQMELADKSNVEQLATHPCIVDTRALLTDRE